MASEQARRETSTKEKNKVPKAKDSDAQHQKQVREGISAAVDEAEKRKGVVEKPGGKSDQETKGISFDEILKHRQTAQQNSIEAIRDAEERYAKEKGMQRRAGEKTGDAKDTVMPATQKVKDFTAEKGQSAGEKASGYAKKVKDTAKVGGLGAAQFTLEKTAEATKGVTDVAANVAGYTGEKAVQAKDAVSSGVEKAAHYAGDKIAAVRDGVVSSQESAAEYAGKKKEEAQNEEGYKNQSEMHDGGEHRREQGMQPHKGEVHQEINETLPGFGETTEEIGNMLGGITRTMAKPAENAQKHIRGQGHQETGGGGGGGGLLHAIVETILEIGQTTKELLVGRGRRQ